MYLLCARFFVKIPALRSLFSTNSSNVSHLPQPDHSGEPQEWKTVKYFALVHLKYFPASLVMGCAQKDQVINKKGQRLHYLATGANYLCVKVGTGTKTLRRHERVSQTDILSLCPIITEAGTQPRSCQLTVSSIAESAGGTLPCAHTHAREHTLTQTCPRF